MKNIIKQNFLEIIDEIISDPQTIVCTDYVYSSGYGYDITFILNGYYLKLDYRFNYPKLVIQNKEISYSIDFQNIFSKNYWKFRKIYKLEVEKYQLQEKNNKLKKSNQFLLDFYKAKTQKIENELIN